MPSPELHRYTLANGLRVVLAPDRTVPVVGVSVHYDVGFRSEPENRTGFAHLFEHLMFQGSESLEKLAHFRHVQSSGGTFNGSTHPDYTDYFEILPSAAMERALFLEADRMRAPRITEENLRNQVDVVKEEIRLNVLNRPYGGFPWIKLPAALYQTFPNAHNGYGDFTELEQASLRELATKIVGEQRGVHDAGFYFYSAEAAAAYSHWASANLELWQCVVEALDDPSVNELLAAI